MFVFPEMCSVQSYVSYRSVALNHSLSDLTDIHLNTVVFLGGLFCFVSPAFSGGRRFQGHLCSPVRIVEVTNGNC